MAASTELSTPMGQPSQNSTSETPIVNVKAETPAKKDDSIPTVVVTNDDFATEVQMDRLNLLWRITAAIGVLILFIGFIRRTSNGGTISMMAVGLLLGAVITGQLLRREIYGVSVWTYLIGVMSVAWIPMLTGNTDALRIAPFFFPFVIFLVGIMLPPVHTVIVVGVALVSTFLVPYYVTDSWAFLSIYPFIAATITILAALFAMLSTGDLYQITGWALENYQRERRTSVDLFENRQRLEKSLVRSQILGEKLQEINDELESAKHFRGQFLANMSHELRTPLNAIIGFSETMLSFPMMYDDVQLPEAYRRDLEQIHNSGQQLLTVINDILDLSKVDAGKLEVNLARVELDPLIDSVMMTAAGLVSKKPVELKRALKHPLPDVYGDESRLRQVLLNLYSNAAKFTDEGSITIQVIRYEDGVRISIIDTGAGIPEDKLETVFEEFTQAEAAGRDPRAGAGLGLTISRRLLGLMSGRIWAESVEGEGATFHVFVPIYEPGLHGTNPKRGTQPLVKQTHEVN